MTPHSGYHWRGQTTRFFEGWYFRLTLPACRQTFAFMYSIDDPAGGGNYSGGAAQILGPYETYYCRTFPAVNRFWAERDRLALGHWRKANGAFATQPLAPEAFVQHVEEGYQVVCTHAPGYPQSHHHQGKLLFPSGQVHSQWNYQVIPIDGWGGALPDVGRKSGGDRPQKATAGWLSYFPVFEPGWQILMAHGLASGWITWQGKRYDFEQAPAYAEKNWGGAFPAKWFWLQCNAFADEPSLSLTAAAGAREVLGWRENVGLIGIHHQGKFYEFISTQTRFTWAVEPWGYWHLTATSDRHRVTLTGRAAGGGTWVRVPTKVGLQFYAVTPLTVSFACSYGSAQRLPRNCCYRAPVSLLASKWAAVPGMSLG